MERLYNVFCVSSAIIAAVLAFAWSPTANAEDGLLVLVTEEMIDDAGVERAFWWESGAAPAWSPTDLALRDALRTAGAGFAEPQGLATLSKIYRRPTPTDTNATAMATVFGRSRVLVGVVQYRASEIRPLGLVGWRANVSVRLVEKTGAGADVLRTVELERSRWAASDSEALSALRAEIAGGVAVAVSAGLRRNVGEVGLDGEELTIGIVAPSTRAAVDAVRRKLESLAGVTAVAERWAAEGIIVLEVNPGVVDSRPAMQQYISLLTTEGAGRWRVSPVPSRWPNVAALRLEEEER